MTDEIWPPILIDFYSVNKLYVHSLWNRRFEPGSTISHIKNIREATELAYRICFRKNYDGTPI